VTFYGQHREDETLARLLGPGYDKRRGFYIDIGAWSPNDDSVTRHFYDLGWHGVNVEPQPGFYGDLCNARPRDVNLPWGIDDVGGTTQTFTIIQATGLSTFHPEYRKKWSDVEHSTMEVSMHTLREVCERYAPRDIDFLKIDVEGWERQVIAGGDWVNYRPRLLCIEATEPGTVFPTHDEWEHLLLGYDLVATDMVNRFYEAR
jgi:FkbM family methyltransferase